MTSPEKPTGPPASSTTGPQDCNQTEPDLQTDFAGPSTSLNDDWEVPDLSVGLRVVLLTLGTVSLALGLVGLAIPIVPQTIPLALGMALLTLASPRMRAAVDRRLTRWPKAQAVLRRFQHRLSNWLRSDDSAKGQKSND